jgi:cytochrome c biogenesis protein CcdA
VGGLVASLAAFGVAGLLIVLLLFGLALAIGLAQEGLVARLRAETQQVKRWGGVVLIVVGIWTLVIGIWADFFARLFPV